METLNIDESYIQQKECFDPITLESSKSIDFLRENEFNNILVILKEGDTNQYQIACFKKTYLTNLLKTDTDIRIPCSNISGDPHQIGNIVDAKRTFYKLNFVFGSFYVTEDTLMEMIEGYEKIFYLERNDFTTINRTASLDVYKNERRHFQGLPYPIDYLVSGVHCGTGSNINVYNVKICGGEKCLKDIFGPSGEEEIGEINFERHLEEYQKGELEKIQEELQSFKSVNTDKEIYDYITRLIEDTPEPYKDYATRIILKKLGYEYDIDTYDYFSPEFYTSLRSELNEYQKILNRIKKPLIIEAIIKNNWLLVDELVKLGADIDIQYNNSNPLKYVFSYIPTYQIISYLLTMVKSKEVFYKFLMDKHSELEKFLSGLDNGQEIVSILNNFMQTYESQKRQKEEEEEEKEEEEDFY